MSTKKTYVGREIIGYNDDTDSDAIRLMGTHNTSVLYVVAVALVGALPLLALMWYPEFMRGLAGQEGVTPRLLLGAVYAAVIAVAVFAVSRMFDVLGLDQVVSATIRNEKMKPVDNAVTYVIPEPKPMAG